MDTTKIRELRVGITCHISNSQVTNLLQVSYHFIDLLAGLLVYFNDLIFLERSKHASAMHAILSLY